MIERYQVKFVARRYLETILKENASAKAILLAPYMFNKWVQLCTDQCNQFDKIGVVSGQPALQHFIKQAVVAYARHQLDRACIEMEKKPEPTMEQ